jgi:hypothetical protein
MRLPDPIIALTASAALLGLFTWLLVAKHITGPIYLGLVPPTLLLSVVIAGFSRLQEVDLKNARVILREIERKQAELAEMYGGIENLKRQPLVLDEARLASLGIGGHLTNMTGTARYVAGCLKRERERLAKIFVNSKAPAEIATAILDSSLDDNVFKWNGPESPLDVPPKSLEQREAEKQHNVAD